jgi:hypothetical protein
MWEHPWVARYWTAHYTQFPETICAARYGGVTTRKNRAGAALGAFVTVMMPSCGAVTSINGIQEPARLLEPRIE